MIVGAVRKVRYARGEEGV